MGGNLESLALEIKSRKLLAWRLKEPSCEAHLRIADIVAVLGGLSGRKDKTILSIFSMEWHDLHLNYQSKSEE